MQLSEKIAYPKKSNLSNRLLMLFFWKPISNLVIWQIFRIFGHSLTESQGLEESVWGLFRHFFRYSPFSLKVVPFSQFWTKSNNSNTHFRAFFMLYTNQITKIKKYIFLVRCRLILDEAGPSFRWNFGFFFRQNKRAPIQVKHFFRNKNS